VRNCNEKLQLMTTGRGRWAGRLVAACWLFLGADLRMRGHRKG